MKRWSISLLLLPGCREPEPGPATEASTSGSTSDTTGTDTDTDPTGATVGGTMTSSGETSEPGCTDNEMCPADAPFCGATMECVTCDAMPMPDVACAEASAEAPLCVDGVCVQCTAEDASVCTNAGLVCDEESGACVPCTEHEQCESGACQLVAGTCFGPDSVVHVDGDGGLDFTTVVAAVNAVAASGVGVIVVHELNGGGSYQGAALINGGKIIALLAAPGESPIVQGTGGNPGLRVQDAGTVLYMDGLEVSLAAAEGVRVDGALAWLDRSRIVQNSGGGIVAQNGAELTLRNCFVGGSNNNVDAMRVDDASADITYSSLTSGFAAATALTCNAALAVSVSNSILLVGAASDAVVCPEATIATSATEDLVGPFDGTQGWFVDYFGADLSLSLSGATTFANIAQWNMGDPPTDIDGDPRPAIDGTLDYAGADVP